MSRSKSKSGPSADRQTIAVGLILGTLWGLVIGAALIAILFSIRARWDSQRRAASGGGPVTEWQQLSLQRRAVSQSYRNAPHPLDSLKIERELDQIENDLGGAKRELEGAKTDLVSPMDRLRTGPPADVSTPALSAVPERPVVGGAPQGDGRRTGTAGAVRPMASETGGRND